MHKSTLWLSALICLIWVWSSAQATEQTQPFSFELLIAKAQTLATQTYSADTMALPRQLANLNRDDYQGIVFNSEKSFWQDQGLFQLQFLHPGFYYHQGIKIHLVENNIVTELRFDKQLFHYQSLAPDSFSAEGLEFAGFTLHYPLHKHQRFEEFAQFLGAGYFHLLGRNQKRGVLARALAIDTGTLQGEEFPQFREFWLEKPAPGVMQIVIYALLDSPSISGAFRFTLHPRTASMAEVDSVLFPRRNIAKLGIAPLHSMFLFDQVNKQHFASDFRPEVHNSDGLQLHTGTGEWLWRPLVNRQELNSSQFFDNNLRGFGLFQRDREFSNYQDLDAFYQQRPSLWVQPQGRWGLGRIELVEIPGAEQKDNNIISYWVSAEPVIAGQRLEFGYLLTTFLEQHDWPPGGWVAATRIGTVAAPPAMRLFVIDFHGSALPHLGPDQPVVGIVSCSDGQITSIRTQKNTSTGGWRLFFNFTPHDGKTTDIRAFLKLHEHVLTETWNYLWKSA